MTSKTNNTTIIAEAGINHNGSSKKAINLVKAAKKCGADYIKFQIFKPENVVTNKAKKSKYQKLNSKDNETQKNMIEKFFLNYSFFKKIKKECKKNKIKFLCSPFDIESLMFLNSMGEKMIKIPSGEITNYPYLKTIGSLKKRIILSTGMSNLLEIKEALKILIKAGTKKNHITLLHCITSYPAPFECLNLKAINLIKKTFNVNTGFSDHSEGIEAPIAAVALGAKMIEKHLTLDKSLDGPDHKSSLNPVEFSQMVKSIRKIEKALKAEKKVQKCEIENLKLVRKSIVAKIKIKKGEKFNFSNITTKRPATGISPMKWKKILGKKSKKNYFKDDFI
jgi:N,N'-diacetyllegionaminate synthase